MFAKTLHPRWPLCLLVALAAAAWSQAAMAQNAQKKLERRELTLTTADGLELAAVYYPSKRGKEAVPVMLLHDWGRSGADYKGLAEHLQKQGHAVLVPDLRGHGNSTKYRDKELHFNKMPPKVCHYMYARGGDVETCKSFLVKENNLAQLNIEKLTVVGAGLGAAVAMNWSIVDWAWKPVGGYKQGQDVKALILLSPPWTEKSVSVNNVLRSKVITNELLLYIVVGKQLSGANSDANKIFKRIKADRGGDGPENDLIFQAVNTKRQGAELLVPASLEINQNIGVLIEKKIVRKTLDWKERKNPLAGD